MIEKVRKIVTEKKDEIRRQYKAKVKGIFGSHVRGEAHPDSDVDLLVDFDEGVNLFDMIGLEQFLEDKLGCKVDMAGMRDRLIHGYYDVNYSVVWEVVTELISPLQPVIKQILKDMEGEAAHE